jgi:hypothetical protein
MLLMTRMLITLWELLTPYFILAGGAGQNKQHQTTKNTAKLDRETEELKHDKISLDIGKLIQQGRQAKGWSQKELATVSQSFYTCMLKQVCSFCHYFKSSQSVLPL